MLEISPKFEKSDSTRVGHYVELYSNKEYLGEFKVRFETALG
jgi:hypothetical protein